MIWKIKEFYKVCQKEDGIDDFSKGIYFFEIYVLEIQMYLVMCNNNQFKIFYNKVLKVKLVVFYFKIQGIICECGGKMYMSEENWKEVQSDFFEVFCNYDEVGDFRWIQVFKYLLLIIMFMKLDINFFDSQEIKLYKNDFCIVVMMDLVDVY